MSEYKMCVYDWALHSKIKKLQLEIRLIQRRVELRTRLILKTKLFYEPQHRGDWAHIDSWQRRNALASCQAERLQKKVEKLFAELFEK